MGENLNFTGKTTYIVRISSKSQTKSVFAEKSCKGVSLMIFAKTLDVCDFDEIRTIYVVLPEKLKY